MRGINEWRYETGIKSNTFAYTQQQHPRTGD